MDATQVKPMFVAVKNGVKMFRSENYNYNFRLLDGLFQRWGKTQKDDPDHSPVGPEIADIEITTICHGPPSKRGINRICSFCSPAGTKINTPHGFINIEKIKRDYLVIGFDINNNSPKIQTVKDVYERYFVGDLICIELSNGEILKLTPNHNIFVKNKGWIECKDLSESDDIISF